MLFDNALVRREGVRFLNHRLVVFSFLSSTLSPAKSISVSVAHDDAGGEVAVVEETKKRG